MKNHQKWPQMTLKWPWVTFKWPWDPRQLFHWLEHLKCFKSCQTFGSVALMVLVLLRKNLIFHCFLGRWSTLSVYIYMKEHFPRYHQLRVRKYVTCGASYTENCKIIPRICPFYNFFWKIPNMVILPILGGFEAHFAPLRPNSGVTNNRECLKLL